jgi:hypothetical protein
VPYDFEWDSAKAESNLAKHGVSFQNALNVFKDPLLRTRPDARYSDRSVTIGAVEEQLLVVVHIDAETTTEDSQARSRTRIISARRATRRERRAYRDER